MFNIVPQDEPTRDERLLKAEIVNFLEFVDQVMDENSSLFEDSHRADVALITELFSRIHPSLVMQEFIKHVMPFSKQIMDRNQEFFEKNVLKLFAALPQDRVYFVYKLVTEKQIPAEDIDAVWEFLNVFVALGEKAKKDK